MCNDYRLMVDVASIVEDFADLKIKIRFGEGAPNLEAREDIKITDVAPIIRTIEGVRGEGDMMQRRWSWPGPNKRPVHNFRSEGREFSSNRCLIVADGF
jgi:putative SOS response-associated peptidase YedK